MAIKKIVVETISPSMNNLYVAYVEDILKKINNTAIFVIFSLILTNSKKMIYNLSIYGAP